MKAAEIKTTTASLQKKGQPFFEKGGGKGFFFDHAMDTSFFTKNQNTRPIIQPKLTVGQPDDKYEKEADAVADKVVQRLAMPDVFTKKDTGVQTKSLASDITPFIQRKCATCEKEEELQKKEKEDRGAPELQRQPIFEPKNDSALQMKCAECKNEEEIKKKGAEEEEKEIQKKSEQLNDIQRKPIFESEAEPTIQKKSGLRTEQNGAKAEVLPTTNKSITSGGNEVSVIQTKCAACEQEDKLQKKDEEEKRDEEIVTVRRKPIFESSVKPSEEEVLQRTADSLGNSSIPTSVEDNLSNKGGGAPLPSSVNESMSNALGSNLDHVRVHNDSDAVQMSNALNAQAFTHKNDIYFNQGKYDINSTAGRHLLAHEVTHTLQQGGQNSIQRTKGNKTTAKTNQPPSPGWYEGDEGQIDLRENVKKFFVAKITVPNVKHIFTTNYANLPHKPDERENTQRDLWVKKALESRETIAKKIEEKANKENGFRNIEDFNGNKIYFFKLKASKKDFVIGTLDEVINSIILPSWNMRGEWANKHVDHKTELQLGGANTLDNMWLLEATANMSSGALINSELNRKIDVLVKAGNEKADLWKGKKVPTATEIRKNHFITVKEYIKGGTVKGDESDRFVMEEITQKVKPLDGLKALTKKEVDTLKLRGTSSLIKIYFRRSEEQARGWFFDVPNWKPEETVRTKDPFPATIKNIQFDKLTYSPQNNPDQDVGKLEGTAFKYVEDKKFLLKKPVTLYLKESPAIDFGGYVPNSAFQEAVKDCDFIPASPVRVDEVTFDNKQGLVVKGKLLPTIPFMEKADIDIIIDGDGVKLKKVFTSGEIKLPEPFSVSDTTLEIQVGSKGMSVNGMINFGIKNVGEGCLSGSVDQKGNIKLNGTFNVASDLFEKSAICFTYERTSEGESRYAIGGHISLGEGKVKGLKKAEADVMFGNNKLFAKATAEPDIKGVEPIEMFLNIEKDKYSFGGKVPLTGLVPRIKQGELEIEVTKDPSGLKINGKGTVVPDIPGIENDPRITISYNDGGILIQGDLPFKLEKAKAEGSITVGITNLVVDENNQPTGEIADDWTVFGNGRVSIALAKNILAEASVTLQPNGDIIVSGKVGLDRSKQDESKSKKPPFEHTIFEVKPPPIILFAIPPIGASLTLKIKGGARVYASLVPPRIQELSLELIGLNLTNPDDNAEIVGLIAIGMSGKGGFELYLTLTATLSLLGVANVSGSLKGSVGLEANADAKADLKARWSKAKGLTLEKGELSVDAKAQFLAKLVGQIRVYLDLWLAEIDIWEEELEIASVSFGDQYDVGFKVPMLMDDGELKAGELNENSFEHPDLTSESEQQKLVKQAASEDEKVKPPPPPSKEEALRAVNRLKAGSIEVWEVLTMDGDEARGRVALGWITRDTYVMWLKTKHNRLDWTEVAALSLQKDNIDFEEAKNKLRNTEGNMYARFLKAGSFVDDHRFFEIAYPEKIRELMQLVKDPGKGENLPANPQQQVTTDGAFAMQNAPSAKNAPVAPMPIQQPEPVAQNNNNTIQAKSESNASVAASPLSTQVENSSGDGSRLPDKTLAEMNSSFGADFSGVHVHNNAESNSMNRKLNSQAFTHGSDIYFNSGKYDTESRSGKHLLAHELTHVLQQSNGLQGKLIQRDGFGDVRLAEACETLITDVQATPTYKALTPDDKKLADEIISEVNKKNQNDRYQILIKLKLLFDTPEKSEADITIETNVSTATAVKVEKARVSKPKAAKNTNVEEKASKAATRKWTGIKGKFGGGTYYVDNTSATNIVVRAKIFLTPTGTGTVDNVKAIKKMEDGIEKAASTKGYLVDIQFVNDASDPDTFTVRVNPGEWEVATNWSGGDPVGFAHELHHMFAFELDRYNYIESHAGNESMAIPTRLHWFREELKKPAGYNDPNSIMNSASHPNDSDVCTVAGLDPASCITAREKLAKPK
jgi:hypothetical protein